MGNFDLARAFLAIDKANRKVLEIASKYKDEPLETDKKIFVISGDRQEFYWWVNENLPKDGKFRIGWNVHHVTKVWEIRGHSSRNSRIILTGTWFRTHNIISLAESLSIWDAPHPNDSTMVIYEDCTNS